MIIRSALDAFKLLNGVFCIYKPKNMRMQELLNVIRENLCEDLNSMKVRPPGVVMRDIIQEDPRTGLMMTVARVPQIDYADHPLVVGARYMPEDIDLRSVQEMDADCSGVCPLAINEGCELIQKIRKARHVNVYCLSGRLGRATLDKSVHGKVMEKATYKHVSPQKFENLLSKVQATFQRSVFEFAGVDIQSQQAYEMASKGAVRPKEDSPPIIYAMKLVEFESPNFTVECHCISENNEWLKDFVQQIGLGLRTVAAYSGIRKIRHGRFTLDHSLLQKHWTLENIIGNIGHCRTLVQPEALRLQNNVRVDETLQLKSDNEPMKYLESYPAEFETEVQDRSLFALKKDFDEDDEDAIQSAGEKEHLESVRYIDRRIRDDEYKPL